MAKLMRLVLVLVVLGALVGGGVFLLKRKAATGGSSVADPLRGAPLAST
ncbi:MAG: hypothetical protein U0263_39175 [Polyangiaceae bacterium]